MAWNAVVTVEDIVKREKGGTLTLKLELYDTDPPGGDPLFEDTASADIKGNVEGLTRQQLVNRATTEAGTKLLEAAETYLRITDYMSMVNTTAVETAIETEINP